MQTTVEILTDYLQRDVKTLDEHDAETRRLNRDPNATAMQFIGRPDERQHLIMKVVLSARCLVDELGRQS